MELNKVLFEIDNPISVEQYYGKRYVDFEKDMSYIHLYTNRLLMKHQIQKTKRRINEPNTLNLEELRLLIVGHLTFGIENSPKMSS